MMAPPFSTADLAAAALALLVVAALIALARRRRSPRATSRRGQARAHQASDLREFTKLVDQAFRRQGYQIVDSGPSADADFVLRRDHETVLVVCRHWKSSKVGVEDVQRLQASVSARGANGGILLTTGRFARAAAAYAGGSKIKLIDGPALEGLLGKADAARQTSAARRA